MLLKNFFKKLGFIIVAITVASVIYYCKNKKSEFYSPIILATHTNGEHFVGSDTCVQCHLDIYTTHVETAHFNTSGIANSNNIKGSFLEHSNVLDLDQVLFTMEAKNNLFYQNTRIKNRSTEIAPEKLDVVIGSGVRGQSYGTWKESALFQLQTSYYTPSNSWVLSPGYPNYYDDPRPLRDACLKCHTTFAKGLDENTSGNLFNRDQIIYGIDCERCHNTAAKHVAFHNENPDVKEAQFMIDIQSLSRQQRLDVCAQCHSGKRELILKGDSFSFVTGEKLSDYSRNARPLSKDEILDVHGNQYGLLIESECFKKSEHLDCNTCHNSHSNERGKSEIFNLKCIACHINEKLDCNASDAEIGKMNNNCIACHMPLNASNSMTVQLSEKDSEETSFYIRTHLIDIYPNVKKQ
ncbi:multiheme c-type cytochrome [Aurantibacter sp.]|uniref:multiheme c-type cytochrome n=1 Tax=Aurantibacter sp. TaxID=2807103 RepID=UPI0032658E56